MGYEKLLLTKFSYSVGEGVHSPPPTPTDLPLKLRFLCPI